MEDNHKLEGYQSKFSLNSVLIKLIIPFQFLTLLIAECINIKYHSEHFKFIICLLTTLHNVQIMFQKKYASQIPGYCAHPRMKSGWMIVPFKVLLCDL